MKEIALPTTNFAENAAKTAAEFPLYCGALPEMNTLCMGCKVIKGVASFK